jgi:AcrR family transcriptional regulator
MADEESAARRGRLSRARILDAAERLFADIGFDATPTARLASEAGVPKGLVFHYFPTKMDILLTLLRERAPTGGGGLAGRAPASASSDMTGALLAIAHRFHVGDRLTNQVRRIILREGRRHPEVRATTERLYGQVVRDVREVIDACLPAGAPDEQFRHAAAVTFSAALMHAINHHHVTGTPFDMRPVADVVAAALGQS